MTLQAKMNIKAQSDEAYGKFNAELKSILKEVKAFQEAFLYDLAVNDSLDAAQEIFFVVACSTQGGTPLLGAYISMRRFVQLCF